MEPRLDVHEDWRLLEAMELPSMGKTILKFSRLLNTCDDEDYPIGVGDLIYINKWTNNYQNLVEIIL